MGRCSATEVFDPVVEYILKSDLNNEQKVGVIKVLIMALEDYDWDCQDDSAYYGHPIVRQAFGYLHPDWFRENSQ